MLNTLITESYHYFIEAEEKQSPSPISQGLKQGLFQAIPYGIAGGALGGVFGAGAGLIGGVDDALYSDGGVFDIPDMIGAGMVGGAALGAGGAGLYGAKRGFSQGYDLAKLANQQNT